MSDARKDFERITMELAMLEGRSVHKKELEKLSKIQAGIPETLYLNRVVEKPDLTKYTLKEEFELIGVVDAGKNVFLHYRLKKSEIEGR